jgi:hypothetical protein
VIAAITGNPKINMNYPHFYEKITIPYGVTIIGWPCQFINPSLLSEGDLSQLCDAWAEKTCYFKKLTREEKEKRAAEFEADVATGKEKRTTRKPQKDRGGTHAKSCKTVEDDVDSGSDDDNNDSVGDREINDDNAKNNATSTEGQDFEALNPYNASHPNLMSPLPDAPTLVLSDITNAPTVTTTTGRPRCITQVPTRLPQFAVPKICMQSMDHDEGNEENPS